MSNTVESGIAFPEYELRCNHYRLAEPGRRCGKCFACRVAALAAKVEKQARTIEFNTKANLELAADMARAVATERERAAAAVESLRFHGFVECDIPACNCGRWHPRYGLTERFNEIAEELGEETQGSTILAAIKRRRERADAAEALLAFVRDGIEEVRKGDIGVLSFFDAVDRRACAKVEKGDDRA